MARNETRTKICAVCGRPFQWRRKWAACWDDVKYCSDKCRGRRSRTARGGGPHAGRLRSRRNATEKAGRLGARGATT